MSNYVSNANPISHSGSVCPGTAELAALSPFERQLRKIDALEKHVAGFRRRRAKAHAAEEKVALHLAALEAELAALHASTCD